MPKKHVVAEGEYLTLIARRHGFVTNKALLDANAELFAKRRDPNVLNPGDEIVIPAKRVKLLTRATEQVHEFRLKKHEDRLRLVLRDDEQKPLPDQPFKLRVQTSREAPAGSGLEIKGQLSGGHLDVLLPPGAVRAYLTLERTVWAAWELSIGGLDPTHDPVDKKTFLKGVQARLDNLGFRCAVDGELGPKTTAAIARFQKKVMQRDHPTGELDEATRDRLKSEHGG